MAQFRITAQSYAGTHRITRTVEADSEAAALRSVATEADAAGFYVTSIVLAEVTTPTAEVISWGGYWAVVTYSGGKMTVHASRFRSLDTARKSAARRNRT